MRFCLLRQRVCFSWSTFSTCSKSLELGTLKTCPTKFTHRRGASCHTRWSLCLAILFLVALASARADGETRVVIFDADGRETNGSLHDINPDSLIVSGPSPVKWKWSDVVRVRFVGHVSNVPGSETKRSGQVENMPHEPRGSAIWLANGDRLVARGTSIEDEQLRATWRHFPEWPEFSLPLEAVRGVSLSLPQARERRDEIAAWLFDRKEARDELRLLNGDVLSGEIADWREERVALKTGGGEVKLPTSDVRDIGFNPELLTLPESKELCWLLSLRDGSRVTLVASKSRFDGELLKAVHVSGVSWNIPLEAIVELRVLRGRAVFLSDLTPLEAKQTPFLPSSRGWPLQRDRSVASRPLRLGGREFPKGLGMHSRSTVTFDLAGKYRSLHAILGLDDMTLGEGTAACSVEVDGRRLFLEPALSRAKGPLPLPLLDVTGAKRLTLTVDFGDLGDSQDHVDWCDAVLLRDKE